MTRSSRRKRARDASEPASSGARRALDATPFTAAEAAQFAEDGFIILRGVIPAAECRRFLRMAVNPAMAKQGILAGDRSTWPREDDEVDLLFFEERELLVLHLCDSSLRHRAGMT